MAYNEFKPEGAPERDPEQVRKKWSRILPPVKRWAGIYQNNLMHAASGRSEADIKALSLGLYNTEGWPKFTLWEEYVVLADCPKFKDICAQEEGAAPGPKRTRHNLAGDYSSGSGSHSCEQTGEQVEEPAPTHTRRGRPPGQQASIRSARGASNASRVSSAASGSRFQQPATSAQPAITGSHEVLRENIESNLMQQLQDVCSKYGAESDPFLKSIYLKLITRLQRRLGLADDAPGAGTSEGGGEEDEAGEEGDSDTE